MKDDDKPDITGNFYLVEMLKSGVFGALARGAKRGRLDTKRGNKSYYKGEGGANVGWRISRTDYVVDPYKIRWFVVPKMTNLKVKELLSNIAACELTFI